MGDADRPFYKQPWKIIPPIGALLGAIIASFTVWRLVFPPAALPNSSVEYIIDTSAAMNKNFAKRTRLAAAKVDVLDSVKNFSSFQTALRLAGGDDCSSKPTPDVGFNENNAQNFENALGRVRPGGKSDWISALNRAANDLHRSLSAGGITTLYVFVGSNDTCSSSPPDAIDEALVGIKANTNVEVRLKLYGVDPPRRTKQLLRHTQHEAATLGLGQPTFTNVTPSGFCQQHRAYPC